MIPGLPDLTPRQQAQFIAWLQDTVPTMVEIPEYPNLASLPITRVHRKPGAGTQVGAAGGSDVVIFTEALRDDLGVWRPDIPTQFNINKTMYYLVGGSCTVQFPTPAAGVDRPLVSVQRINGDWPGIGETIAGNSSYTKAADVAGATTMSAASVHRLNAGDIINLRCTSVTAAAGNYLAATSTNMWLVGCDGLLQTLGVA